MICIPLSSQRPVNNKMSSSLLIYRRNIVLCAVALVANYTLISLWTNNMWNHLLSPIIDIQQQQQRRVDGQSSTDDRISTGTNDVDDPDVQEQWSNVKLAIYMTTHLPPKHVQYFPCWYDAIQRLDIFKYNADLILYTSTPPTAAQLKLLPFQKIIVKLYNNTGYQNGAIQAMIDPFVSNTNTTWFDEYDWVIRLNPDVLIRHDTWLIQAMLNTSNDGIFHECFNSKNYSKPNPKLHSDFYAFRPKALIDSNVISSSQQHEQQSLMNYTNAEYHVTYLFRNIYNSRRFQFVNGAYNSRPGTCRIEGNDSPVVHTHDLWQYCPNYYNITRDGVY